MIDNGNRIARLPRLCGRLRSARYEREAGTWERPEKRRPLRRHRSEQNTDVEKH